MRSLSLLLAVNVNALFWCSYCTLPIAVSLVPFAKNILPVSLEPLLTIVIPPLLPAGGAITKSSPALLIFELV